MTNENIWIVCPIFWKVKAKKQIKIVQSVLVVTCFLVQYLSNMIQYFINTAIKVCSLLCYTTWSDSTIGIKLWKYKSPGALCCKVSSLRHLDRRKEVRSFRWSRKTWSEDNFKFLSNNVSISVRKNFGHSCLVYNKKRPSHLIHSRFHFCSKTASTISIGSRDLVKIIHTWIFTEVSLL